MYELSYESLACCGVPVCTDGKLKPENNMWTVVKEWRAKYLTSRAVFRGCKADPGPVRYLTPSREVVAGE